MQTNLAAGPLTTIASSACAALSLAAKVFLLHTRYTVAAYLFGNFRWFVGGSTIS